jgi:uncharacterized protein involved in exopolysaccharide biosynthesis
MQHTENQNYASIDIIKFLIRNYKPILLITLFGAIASVVVSLLITPKFKSSVVIFPASTSSVSKALLTDMSMTPKDIMKFGEEEETEQLMQVLQSDEIKARIIQKYNLLDHYKIEKSTKYYKSDLLNEYDANISIHKTEYQAIEIKVLDIEPEYSAQIANNIAALLDSVYNKIQKDRALKALGIVENVYSDQLGFVNQLKDSINSLSNNKLGIYNSLAKQLDEEITHLSLLKSKLNEAKVDAYQDLPHKYVVNPAQTSEKKAYPIRWLIVLVSTLSTFVFALFVLMIIERFKSVKKELNTNSIH